MLKRLLINNLAVIESSEIDFSRGFNVITGETGAGKSLIVKSILLLAGNRADYSLIRRGEDRCLVSAEFTVKNNSKVQKAIQSLINSQSNEIIISRELRKSGISRCFINDSPISLKELKELSSSLLDIHSQHSHQKLLDKPEHIILLDEAGEYQHVLDNYTFIYKRLKQKLHNLEVVKQELSEAQKLYDYNKFVLEELEKVSPKENEEEELKKELDFLENAESITHNSRALAEILYESEDSVYDKIKIAIDFLKKLSEFKDEAADYIKELEPLLITSKEISIFSSDLTENIEYNPFRVEEIRNRLYSLNKLYRKYGSFNELVSFKTKIAEQIATVEKAEETIDLLNMDIQDIVSEISPIAKDLSTQRNKFAQTLSQNITSSIREMEILSGVFDVVITNTYGSQLEANSFNSRGIDKVEFYFSANSGEPLKPLSETASGGEMSRIMIALKALATENSDSVLVFDEIDTGISGEAGVKVGRMIQAIASKQQLIAISHLPQIAAKSDNHIYIFKEEIDNKTFSRSQQLELEDKKKEIARLFSGSKVSEAALTSASELIEK